MSSVHLFIVALLRRWWALLGSAVFTVLAMYALATNQSNRWLVTTSIAAALLLFTFASYSAWDEQFHARVAAEKKFNDNRPIFVLQVVGTQPLANRNSDWGFLLTNCGGRTARYERLGKLRSEVGAYEIFFDEIAALQTGQQAVVGCVVKDRRNGQPATLWEFALDNAGERGASYFWYDIEIEYRDADETIRKGDTGSVCFDLPNQRLIAGEQHWKAKSVEAS